MKFKINGQTAQKVRISPGAQKLIDYVRALPDGEMLTAKNLALAVGLSRSKCSNHANDHLGAENFCMDGIEKLYGNKKTIAAYKEFRNLQD